MSDIRPGDVTIHKCQLSSIDGTRTLNVLPQVGRIDIYESVMQPVILCDIAFVDGIGLRQGFPLIGEERLELSFSTPGLEQRDLDLYAFKIHSVTQQAGNRTQHYVVEFASVESFRNSSRILTRRFSDQISKTIPAILLDELSTEKNIEVETTVGIDNQIISNMAPLTAVDRLRHKAVSASFPSSSYTFYEDKNGFHFVTLEKLLSTSSAPTKVFYFDDAVDVNVTQTRFRDLIHFEPVQVQNTMERLQQGAIRNIVQRFDLITGNVTNVEFDANQLGGIFAKTGNNARDNSTKFNQTYGQQPSSTTLLPFSSDMDNELIADKVSALQAFTAKISQNIVHIHAYGDSSMAIGEPIKCIVKQASGITGTGRMLENNYVVTKIRHQILNKNRAAYTQSCEIINNSFDQ